MIFVKPYFKFVQKKQFTRLITSKKQNYNRGWTLPARMQEEMKLKQVYYSIALIFLIVGVVVWKLNDIYKSDKNAQKQNSLQAQSIGLRSTLVSQISQLRNVLSGYILQIDESKINWVQLKPFYVISQVQEDVRNQIIISKMYTQTGTVAERWSSAYVQQKLALKSTNRQLVRFQLFQDQSGLKHLAIIFFDQDKKNNESRNGILVIGDVSFLQRFFDLQRTSSTTQALLTTENLVAAHSEFDYIANASKELSLSTRQFFIDKQELRGTNLILINYATKGASGYLSMPNSILGIILGLGFMISGIILYMGKMSAVTHQDQQGFSSQVVSQKTETMAQPVAKVKLSTSEDFVKSEREFQQSKSATDALVGRNDILQLSDKKIDLNQHLASDESQFQIESSDLPMSSQEQVVPVQVQACVQQALFNLDKKIKKSSVKISKDFQSFDTVLLDYPRFIKIFEKIILSFLNSHQVSKSIRFKTTDNDDCIDLRIETSIKSDYELDEVLKSEFSKIKCATSLMRSSENELILMFSFVKQIKKNNAVTMLNDTLKQSEVIEPEITNLSTSVNDDLDIDAILSIDDEQEGEMSPVINPTAELENLEPVVDMKVTSFYNESEPTQKFDLKKEMQTTKVKLDQDHHVLAQPNIQITKANKEIDQYKVKIRKPEKT